jgi:hypothetical protein
MLVHRLLALTINVLALVGIYLANSQLAVGGLGIAVTSWKIVDDKTQDIRARDIGKGWLNLGNVGNSVTLLTSCQ